jgi:hypothetical protein
LRKLLVSLGGGDAIHWAPEHDGQSLKYWIMWGFYIIVSFCWQVWRGHHGRDCCPI